MIDLEPLHREHTGVVAAGYARALAATGWDAVVVHAGSARRRTEADDQYWPLRATPHFQHWAPLAEPDAALVVRPGRRAVLARVRVTSFWEKPGVPEREHYAGAFDHAWLDAPEDLRGLLPPGRVAFLGDDGARAVGWGIAPEAVNPRALVAALDQLRVRKTGYEVACLAEANRRAAVGHDAVLAAFRGGAATELDLHLAFLQATRQDDPETPYKNIVAVGANAATLHHVSYGKRPLADAPGGGQSLLLDAGATCEGYCSDITRTWVRGTGAAADAFAGLVAAVEAMQLALCASVRVGRPYEDLHDEAHVRVGRILAEAGVVRMDPDEAVRSGVTRCFLPHGLGHSLGLQCHDVGCAVVRPRPDNPFLRNTSVITEGQVFTIEPGVYFIDGLLRPLREGPHGGAIDWSLVDALAPFGGIRIEDDVVVEGGAAVIRNLSREHLPRGGGTV